MITALDAPPELLDKHEQNFVAKIREHGWFATNVAPRVGEEGPPFSFTTGFWLKFKFPELIVFTLRDNIAHAIFWNIYRGLEKGETFPIGERTDTLLENGDTVLLPVAQQHYQAHLGWSRWFYGDDKFKCLQIVWPSRSGHFPWSPEASDHDRVAQPDLTEGNWFGLRERSN